MNGDGYAKDEEDAGAAAAAHDAATGPVRPGREGAAQEQVGAHRQGPFQEAEVPAAAAVKMPPIVGERVDHYAYWGDPPPQPSPRLAGWIDRMVNHTDGVPTDAFQRWATTNAPCFKASTSGSR